jgi:tetratricopeptide (TPR) repeat protein
MLAGWLLTQSKGGGVALAISAIVVFAVAPGRLRLLVPALIVAALVGPQFGPLTAPFDAGQGLADAARHAGFTMLWLTAAAAVAGAAYALLDRRLELSPRVVRGAGALALAGVAAASIALAAGFFTSVDHPGRFAADHWRSFKHLPENESGSTHFISLGSNRYDFWRVALEDFRDHPLAGIGARGFGPAYLIEGRSRETPARAHSVELDALSEVGIVGFLLLAGALVPLFAVSFQGLRRNELPATAAFAGGAYWLVHASADWNWSIPAVGLPFFLLLGAGAASRRAPPLRARTAVPAGVAAVAVALIAFVPPWLSARLSAQALDSGSSSLRWARRLDPLSVRPYLVQASLASHPAEAIPPLRQAVDKEPRSVEVRYSLGLAYARAGRTRDARRELLVARRLDPDESAIQRALERLRRG